MAVSWAWRVEFLDKDGNIFDLDETNDYAEAVKIGNERFAVGRCHSFDVPLVRTVWTYNEGVLDEDYIYPPFDAETLSLLPKKYAAQYTKVGW